MRPFKIFKSLVGVSVLPLLLFCQTSQGSSNVLWQPNIEAISFKGRDETQFLQVKMENGEAAITRLIRTGENYIGQYMTDEKLNVIGATISFDIKFEEGFVFPKRDHKLPLGIWGGVEGSSCFAGGCHFYKQDGFSVRLIESAGQPFVYVYSLSRPVKENSMAIYGELIGCQCNYSFPIGSWVNVELTVRLNPNINEMDEVELIVDSIPIVQSRKVKLRNSEDWLLRGPMLTDLFGGSVKAVANQSVKSQQVWYKNYKIKRTQR